MNSNYCCCHEECEALKPHSVSSEEPSISQTPLVREYYLVGWISAQNSVLLSEIYLHWFSGVGQSGYLSNVSRLRVLLVLCSLKKDLNGYPFGGYSNSYSFVTLQYFKVTNVYQYFLVDERNGPPLERQAIWFHRSSPASLYLLLNQHLAHNPNSWTPWNLWAPCQSATALQWRKRGEIACSGSLRSHLELAFKLGEVWSSVSPSRGPNENFALRLRQNTFPFSLLVSPRSG